MIGVLWCWHVRGDDALFLRYLLVGVQAATSRRVRGSRIDISKFAVLSLFPSYYYLLLLPAIRVPSSTVRASGRGGVRRPN